MDYRLEQLRFELREDPSSRIFFKLGEHLRREGEVGEAIEVLQAGLEQHSNYIAAWVSLGRAQLENGDAEGAQAALERALQLDPENAVAARAMGEAAIVNERWVAAVKAFKRARGLVPQDDALDERIAFVEAQLAELGQLEGPADSEKAPPPASVVGETPDEPEAGAEAEPTPEEAPAHDEPSPEHEAPAGEAAEEPFDVKAGDTGNWEDPDDVFAAGWVEEEAPSEEHGTVAEDETLPEAEPIASEPSHAYATPPPLTDDDVSSMVGADEEPMEFAEPAVVVHDEEPPNAVSAEAPQAEFSAPEPDPVIEPEPAPVFEGMTEPTPEPEAAVEDASEAETAFLPALDTEPEPEPVPESEAETVFQPAFEAAVEAEAAVDQAARTGAEPEAAFEAVSEPEPELVPVEPAQPESLPESWPDLESELEKGVDGLPLPTMTLARLAIDQGDLDLAERTLRGVLEREPGHGEAEELLETLLAGPPQGDAAPGAAGADDPRAEALQRCPGGSVAALAGRG
jgi:Flp pilus assembly protein TadD